MIRPPVNKARKVQSLRLLGIACLTCALVSQSFCMKTGAGIGRPQLRIAEDSTSSNTTTIEMQPSVSGHGLHTLATLLRHTTISYESGRLYARLPI